ncbi:MAG: metallophosphoesterase [Lachnospiraceae bacterium]|nr:metallophosphoesterase [Lachnospiraceae bacterium]
MKKKRKRIILCAVLLILVIWTVWGNVTVGVTRFTVSSGRIPASFDGFRIALISDVHDARFGENNRRLIELIEKEKPDVIAITGDLVDSNRTDIDAAEDLVRRLNAIAPCYYVTGNHEAYIKEHPVLEQKLLSAGVIVLHNESAEITRNGETVRVAGLEDPAFSDISLSAESILGARLKSMDLTDDYCILLSHRPEAFPAYVSENVDLVLSGHAHGGQFRLPFIGGLVAPGQGLFPKYDAGQYEEGRTVMIVSRGIGNSIIPVRFNNRPEIVMVELRCP